MTSALCYSLRQLSPFQGLVHIVSIPQARAVTGDGRLWKIEVSCENQQHAMGLQQPGLARRYVLWGVWSKNAGLKAMPLDPMLDIPKDSVIEHELIPAIEANLQQLPFTPRDHYELWILDHQHNLPAALAATRIDGFNLDQLKASHWRASTHSKRDFKPARVQTTINPLLKLEQLIADNTCCPIRSQWFLRDEFGNGKGLVGHNLEAELSERNLARNQFPELLIREDWDTEASRILAEDYQNWLSPKLLTLHHLTPTIRARLEVAAQSYAIEASQLLHLYPEKIDQKIIHRIQVEARLRLAAEKD